MNKNTFVFIDEYTHVSNVDLYILSKLNNVKIIALGDEIQEGYTGMFKKGGSAWSYHTATVSISIRSDNNNKKSNISRLSKFAYLADKLNTAEHPKIDVLNILNDIKKDNFFRYYEDNKEPVKGEKVVDGMTKDEFINIINKIPEGENLAYIYENTAPEFADLGVGKDNIFFIKREDIQGLEFDYTVVDVNYTPYNENSKVDTYLDNICRLYTMVSRSKKGSYIINRDEFRLGLAKETSSYTNITFNPEEISNYQKLTADINTSLVEAGVLGESSVEKKKGNNDSLVEKDDEDDVVVVKIENKKNGLKPQDITSITTPNKDDDTDIIANAANKIKVFTHLSVDQLNLYPNFDMRKSDDPNGVDDTISLSDYGLVNNLVHRSTEEIQDVIGKYDYDATIKNKLAQVHNVLRLKLGVDISDEANKILTSGKYYIKKVDYTTDLKLKDVQSTSEPKYVYIVYKKLTYNNLEYNVTLGYITTPDKDIPTKIKEFALDKEYPIKDPTIKHNKANILDRNGDPTLTSEEGNLRKYSNDNPWFQIGDQVLVLDHNSTEYPVGQPFVLTSRDLFKSSSEFVTSFKNRLLDPKNVNDNFLFPIMVNFKGYTFEEYRNKIVNIKSSEVSINSFTGQTQGFRLLKQIKRAEAFLSDYIEISNKKPDPGNTNGKELDTTNINNYRRFTELYTNFNNDLINASHYTNDFGAYLGIIKEYTLEDISK